MVASVDAVFGVIDDCAVDSVARLEALPFDVRVVTIVYCELAACFDSACDDKVSMAEDAVRGSLP